MEATNSNPGHTVPGFDSPYVPSERSEIENKTNRSAVPVVTPINASVTSNTSHAIEDDELINLDEDGEANTTMQNARIPLHFENPLNTYPQIVRPGLADQNQATLRSYSSGCPTTSRTFRSGNGNTNSSASGTNASMRKRRATNLSEDLYGENQDDIYHRSVPLDQEIKRMKFKQSRKLPEWVETVLSVLLGVRRDEHSRTWFGKFMYIVTVLLGALFMVAFTWFTVYDIKNKRTKMTILTGFLSVIIALYWVVLGIYSNQLAIKLFSSQKFMDSVRLHSRTIFKMNAAGLIMILAILIVVLNNYGAGVYYLRPHCFNITIVHPMICEVVYGARVTYSIIWMWWNVLLSIVLISVCRTHTIGIRRFIRELEDDGKVYEYFYLRSKSLTSNSFVRSRSTGHDEVEDYLWDEDFSPTSDAYKFTRPSRIYIPGNGNPGNNSPSRRQSARSRQSPTREEVQRIAAVFQDPNAEVDPESPGPSNRTPSDGNPPIIVVKGSSNTAYEDIDEESLDDGMMEVPQKHLIQPEVHSRPSSGVSSPQHSMKVNMNSPRKFQGSVSMATDVDERSTSSVSEHEGFSNDDILMRYWKISTRLRTTSIALQRWLSATVTFIIIWSLTFIVYWINNETTLLGLAEFSLPILILPLLCSAYGEVNNEGRRMLRCICPAQQRMDLLFFLMQCPLQMTAFGFPITYSTIGGTVGALVLAFCTKVLLDELSTAASEGGQFG